MLHARMRSCLLSLILGTLLLARPCTAAAKKRKRKSQAAARLTAAAMQHHQVGTMAHVHGDLDGAKKAFRDAIALKPDFAYAYFRLAIVIKEQAEQEKLRLQKSEEPLKAARPTEDAVPVFRQAIALDGKDEMAYYSLGNVLKDRLDLQGAKEVFSMIASRVNPRSAQAYWALGKVHAASRDEFDSDPDDEDDPEHFYEKAVRLPPCTPGLRARLVASPSMIPICTVPLNTQAALKPETFSADGSRIRLIEPMTPERETRLEDEAQGRREAFLAGLNGGSTRMRVAGEDEAEGTEQAHALRADKRR